MVPLICLKGVPDITRTERSQVLWLTFIDQIKRPWRFPAIFLWSVFSQRTGKAVLFPTHSQRLHINAVLQWERHNAQSGSCRVIVRAWEALCRNISPNKWCCYEGNKVIICPRGFLTLIYTRMFSITFYFSYLEWNTCLRWAVDSSLAETSG